MRRRFARRGARPRQDRIWCPFITDCLGSPLANSCTTNLSASGFQLLLDASDWQPEASSATTFDHAMLLRTILTFTWTMSTEAENAALIWGLVRLDRNVTVAGLGNPWLTGMWGGYDVLWGPHVQSVQSFASNPTTIDLGVKRKLSTNDRIYLCAQANSGADITFTWAAGRFLLDRLTR